MLLSMCKLLLMIGRTGFRESTGIFWAHPCMPRAESNIRAVSFRADLLREKRNPMSVPAGFQARGRPFVASSSSALKYTVLSTP